MTNHLIKVVTNLSCEKKLSYDDTFQSDMDFDVIVG